MSTKEEKPTLAGVRTKARKRNITVPLDPGSFAKAVIEVFNETNQEGFSVNERLEAALPVLDATDLDFSRYGDTLFEVLFAGGRMGAGANVVGEEARVDISVLACPPDRDAINPFVSFFASMIRRRKFLIKALQATLCKLLQSLEFFDAEGRMKIAIATSCVFTARVGVLPDEVFQSMLNDRLVAKGMVLEFITVFFEEFMAAGNSLVDLVNLLTKAKVITRLEDFFPPGKRSNEAFNEHFAQHGLDELVAWHTQTKVEANLAEVRQSLTTMVKGEEGDFNVDDMVEFLHAKNREMAMPEADLLGMLWDVMLSELNLTGKAQSQITQAILASIKTYHKAFSAFCSSAKTELALLVKIQVSCYEDSRLLKSFTDTVRMFYQVDILEEDTIIYWYKKGSSPKGRNVLLKDIQPFIYWLENEGEEDESDEDGDD